MNHIYRIIWNETLGAWVAVAENVKRKGKRSAKAVLCAGAAVLLGLSGANASGTITKYEGDRVSSSTEQIENIINLNSDLNLKNNSIGVVATGANGKNGRAGALFVPPKSGGAGSSIPDEKYYAYVSEYDEENEDGIAPLTVKFISSTELSRLGYRVDQLDDPIVVAAISNNITSFKEVTFTPIDSNNNGLYADEDNPKYNLVETIYTKTGDAFIGSIPVRDYVDVILEFDATTESVSKVNIKSGDYSGLSLNFKDQEAVEPGTGFTSGVVTTVNGNDYVIRIDSANNGYDKVAVKSTNKGGNGGNGGKYILGGKGKPGGKGGNASDSKLVVNDLKIIIGSEDNKINDSTGLLAESIGGKGGNGGGSYTLAAAGGSGNAGGSGGKASVYSTNVNIQIYGDDSSAIAAISSGGQGGGWR